MKHIVTYKFSFRLFISLIVVLAMTFSFSVISVFAGNTTSSFLTPSSNTPVALLVGLNSNELSYREIAGLGGFEFFSVPYRTDIKTLVEQINPSQIIIKHPSGFVGLYSSHGQFIRGVRTAIDPTIQSTAIPPSIIQPTEANPIAENLYYPGSVTGSVPHGGVGYTPAPKGRGIFRHLLKLAAFGSITPFTYPGFFTNSNTGNLLDQDSLFSSLMFPLVPTGITAASAYADSVIESREYNQARTQPRDYMFQPIFEEY